MFLNLLNDEEKSIFLKLAISVVQADGKLEESEKTYIAEYAREMGISDYNLNDKIDSLSLAESIGNNSTDSVKRIFLLELIGCANADGEFADSEKILINSFIKAFKMSETTLNECIELLSEYTKISSKIMTFIKEGK